MFYICFPCLLRLFHYCRCCCCRWCCRMVCVVRIEAYFCFDCCANPLAIFNFVYRISSINPYTHTSMWYARCVHVRNIQVMLLRMTEEKHCDWFAHSCQIVFFSKLSKKNVYLILFITNSKETAKTFKACRNEFIKCSFIEVDTQSQYCVWMVYWNYFTVIFVLFSNPFFQIKDSYNRDNATCVWYGVCNKDEEGKIQYCSYDGPAKHLNSTGQKLLSKFCPHLVNGDNTFTCCDFEQVE